MRIAVLIDGGYLRAAAKRDGHKYRPAFIQAVAEACFDRAAEELFRILYYDCGAHLGKKPVVNPLDPTRALPPPSDAWLDDLAARDYFAVRRGTLKYRGWKLKKTPVPGQSITADDLEPDFQQKGVDMRIGLDIANFADTRMVERLIIIAGDTDFVPALKYGRKAGLQIVAVELPKTTLTREFLAHVDLRRPIAWPALT